MQSFEHSLPMRLYRALNAVMPRFRAIFAEFDLTEPQWRVLRVLWEHGPLPFRTVSERTLIPAPSLVGVVDRLAARGLVERHRGHGDRRLVNIATTAAGAALRERVLPAVEQAYDELSTSIEPEIWAGLTQGLDALAMVKITP